MKPPTNGNPPRLPDVAPPVLHLPDLVMVDSLHPAPLHLLPRLQDGYGELHAPQGGAVLDADQWQDLAVQAGRIAEALRLPRPRGGRRG